MRRKGERDLIKQPMESLAKERPRKGHDKREKGSKREIT